MTTLTVTGGTLFGLAAQVYGDALLWPILATANQITDPWLNGIVVLVIPAPMATLG